MQPQQEVNERAVEAHERTWESNNGGSPRSLPSSPLHYFDHVSKKEWDDRYQYCKLQAKKRQQPCGRRGVAFRPEHKVLAYIESLDDMTDEERENRWFHPEDLEDFKMKARELCQLHYKGQRINGDDESIRGMSVYFPSRQRNHKQFVHHVLEAYHVRCARNADHVSLLAEKWSSKNKERAVEKGFQDWYEAYAAPAGMSLPPSLSSSPPPPTSPPQPSLRTVSSQSGRPAPPKRTGSNSLAPGQPERRL